VAPAKRRGQADRYLSRDVGSPEIVDVVVLGDDEALPIARRRPVDLSPHLQDHGSPRERELRRVRVRNGDHVRGPVGSEVAELAAVAARGEIRDDVDLFASLLESMLERIVVRRHDEKLVRRAPLTQEAWKRREESVRDGRLALSLGNRVQLVIERSRATGNGGELRHARELEHLAGRIAEALRDCHRMSGSSRPEHRHQAPGKECVGDLGEVLELPRLCMHAVARR